MNGGFNWRRFLAFMPVTVALAFLTVYGPEILPHYLVGAIVVILFFAFFVIFYGSPRWKPTLPPITLRGLLFLFASLAIAFIGVAWVERRFRQVLPWLVFLLIFALLSVFLLHGRRAQK
jgi:uncharacterized membrane protein YfcA